MAHVDQLVAHVSQELLEELTAGGTRDFRQTRLSQLEQEVYGLADRISARLLQGMLEDQSQQAQGGSLSLLSGAAAGSLARQAADSSRALRGAVGSTGEAVPEMSPRFFPLRR